MAEEIEKGEGNEAARAAQRAELEKLGIKPAPEVKEDGEDSELDEEETDEEETSEDEEEDSEKDDEKEEESEDEEDEEDEEEEEGQSHKKKGVPYRVYNDLRSELRELRKEMKEGKDKGEEKAPVTDDFMKRTEDLAKEIGVENPEGLKKIMSLVQEVVKGSRTDLEKKLSDLEEKYSEVTKDAPIKDNFETEWTTFAKTDFKKDFPNATAEELEQAEKLMNTLSHTPQIGGKVYKDDKGRDLIDPYELDYIYFKNREKFQEIVSGKRSRGMEDSRTQGIKNNRENKDENKPLAKNASVESIRDYEKRSARAMEGMDNLSEPIDDTI
jgi:hypothetical protein